MKISEIKRIEELLAKHGGVYGMARALQEAEAENERLQKELDECEEMWDEVARQAKENLQELSRRLSGSENVE